MPQSNLASHDLNFSSHCLTLSLATILKDDPLAYQSLSQKNLVL
jgi:hypothetical protein